MSDDFYLKLIDVVADTIWKKVIKNILYKKGGTECMIMAMTVS